MCSSSLPTGPRPDITTLVPGEIMRREVELDPQVSHEEIMSREVELGCETWDLFRFELFLNNSATDIVFVTLPSTAVETAIAQCTITAQWRGDTALTLPLFWRRSKVSPIFFGRYPLCSLYSFTLPSSPPPPPPQPHPRPRP